MLRRAVREAMYENLRASVRAGLDRITAEGDAQAETLNTLAESVEAMTPKGPLEPREGNT